jgi:hypothetical protein
MKQFFLYALCILSPLFLRAQIEVKEFSFINDRIFAKAQDLYGHTFVPYKGRLLNTRYDHAFKMGLVVFKISSSSVDIVENIKFTMNGFQENKRSFRLSISSINTSQDGLSHEFVLRDLRQPDALSSLKIVLNSNFEPVEIYFQPVSETQRIYYIMPLPPEIEKRDNRYFTHDEDINLSSPDLLWGKTIVPFATLTDFTEYKEFNRLYPADAITLKFEERTVVKGKKEKLAQYFILSKAQNGQVKQQEWLIKKIKETADEDVRFSGKFFLLQLKDETTEEEKTMIIRRRNNQLRQIEFDGVTYITRRGKRKE